MKTGVRPNGWYRRKKGGYSLTDYNFDLFYDMYPRKGSVVDKAVGIYSLKGKLKTMESITEFSRALIKYSETAKKNNSKYYNIMPWPDFCRKWSEVSVGVK